MGRDGIFPLDEQPQHSVVVDSFYIATTEVTNHQFFGISEPIYSGQK